ncbi:MAG TPA: HTTM domain-containing protein [Chryseolinea sp.]|nr:HTTM domain-containing protein [Chryseolinea sp.]
MTRGQSLSAKQLIDGFSSYLTGGSREPVATRIFLKALVCYMVIRLILLWPVCRVMLHYHRMVLPGSLLWKIILAPSYLADQHPDAFFVVAIALAIVLLYTIPHHAANFLFCWLTVNVYYIHSQTGDGSDLMLLMLSVWCVPMVPVSLTDSGKPKIVQITLFNLGRLFCQFATIFIYLSSGVDKLASATWRSGYAFEYIRHLEGLYNPHFPALFQNHAWDLVLSWITILLELAFGVLVWQKQFRTTVLLCAAVFHLVIWWMVSLPDFSVIMIVSLLIFVNDDDYDVRAAQRRVRRDG